MFYSGPPCLLNGDTFDPMTVTGRKSMQRALLVLEQLMQGETLHLPTYYNPERKRLWYGIPKDKHPPQTVEIRCPFVQQKRKQEHTSPPLSE
mmetsp:Transcript_23131/g.58617  ORF Transcript_23131/g.58617 Transcript_23131/m.58617 type:complete len:92 (-) Transcript_23131:70-345(-)